MQNQSLRNVQQLLDCIKNLDDADLVFGYDRHSSNGRANPSRHPLIQITNKSALESVESKHKIFSYAGVAVEHPNEATALIHTVGQLRGRLKKFKPDDLVAGFKSGPMYTNFYAAECRVEIEDDGRKTFILE